MLLSTFGDFEASACEINTDVERKNIPDLIKKVIEPYLRHYFARISTFKRSGGAMNRHQAGHC